MCVCFIVLSSTARKKVCGVLACQVSTRFIWPFQTSACQPGFRAHYYLTIFSSPMLPFPSTQNHDCKMCLSEIVVVFRVFAVVFNTVHDRLSYSTTSRLRDCVLDRLPCAFQLHRVNLSFELRRYLKDLRNPPTPLAGAGRAMGLLSSAATQIALIGGVPFFRARARAAMVGLQGHWGEGFGGTFLDAFSLRRACRATGESVLEEFLCFGVVDALILARPAGPLGRAFWTCIFGWLLAMPKLYHHYGLQGRRSWP